MRKTKLRILCRLSLLIACTLSVAACSSSPPSNRTDICEIFEQRKSWHKAAKASEQRWDIPLPVSMAVIYQESGFRARAKPERKRFLWIFPGARPSSAYGYSQALDGTWDEYKASSGNRGAKRSQFSDAVDFVAWYNATSHRISGIANTNARDLYLAYHEGNGGYQRGSYREKAWLLETAAKVQQNADRFEHQYATCKDDLNKGWIRRVLL